MVSLDGGGQLAAQVDTATGAGVADGQLGQDQGIYNIYSRPNGY